MLAVNMALSRRAFVTGTTAATAALPYSVRAEPGAPDSPEARLLAGSPVPGFVGLARTAVAAAVAAGARYADARVVRWREEQLSARDGKPERVATAENLGLGVRVLLDGAWGYAATPTMTVDAVTRAAATAIAVAEQQARLRASMGSAPVELAPLAHPVARGSYVTPHVRDPFAVPTPEKMALLIEATAIARQQPQASVATASLLSVMEDKLYVSSEGAQTHQIMLRLMPMLSVTVVSPQRGFASCDLEAPAVQAGYESVEQLDLVARAPEVATDALRKLHADVVSPGARHIVLAPSHLWLTIHESLGHSTELDRMMGLEANLAGTSFLKLDDIGTRQLAAQGVDVVADRTQPGGLATCGWDDEGVATTQWDLLRAGTLVDTQTTRADAAVVGAQASLGCAYGEGFGGEPFSRMPNISLRPGPEGYVTEDLINATEHGVYITGRGAWSIDQQRLNFQFSGQRSYEIRRGRITKPLQDVAYRAQTQAFWRSCDMLGGEGTYRLFGSFYDGKGEPGQNNAVSHGCPSARFRAFVRPAGSLA